jgi:hypothetical protein
MLRTFVLPALLFVATVHVQPSQPPSVPPDSPRWDLVGRASVTEYQGRTSILLDGGLAALKDFAPDRSASRGSNGFTRGRS